MHFRGNGIVYHRWINIATSCFCSAGDSGVAENLGVGSDTAPPSVCVSVSVCRKRSNPRETIVAGQSLADRLKHHSVFFHQLSFLPHFYLKLLSAAFFLAGL